MDDVMHDALSRNPYIKRTSLSTLRDWLMIVNKVRC